MTTQIITTENLTNETIDAALNNPEGLEVENTPEVRKAVANRVDDFMTKLNAKTAGMTVEDYLIWRAANPGVHASQARNQK